MAVPARAAAAEEVVLENAHVRVVIDATLGRVTAFTPTATGRDLLWRPTPGQLALEASGAGYWNHGGDKVWPAPQPVWRYALGRIWPPDVATDGRGARLERIGPRGVRLVFPTSDAFGTTLQRTFALDADAAVLRVHNRIRQEWRSPFPAQVWSITQVPLPERVLFDVATDAPVAVAQPVNMNAVRAQPPLEPEPFLPGSVAQGEGWLAFRPGERGQKLGSLGRWLAGVWPDGVLVLTVPYDPAGMYPEATSLQVYHDDNYAELETLGPARHLVPGDVLENEVVWRWFPELASGRDDEALVRDISAALPSVRSPQS